LESTQPLAALESRSTGITPTVELVRQGKRNNPGEGAKGFYPLNVLNTLKMVPEVPRIFCATANPTEVVLAETEQGKNALGVVDGFSPKGVEDEGEIKWRKDFQQIGYKL
jgi:hypothetical protein